VNPESPAQITPYAARCHGDGKALVTADRTLTHHELDALSDAFAARLLLEGVQQGDRVSLLSENRWEWVVAYHGILKAGAVVNPLNAMLTPPEAVYASTDCGAVAVVGSPQKLDELGSFDGHLGRFDDPDWLVCADDVLGEVPHAYVIPRPGCELDVDAIMQGYRAQLAAYKVPRAIDVVSGVPLTSSGKVMRRELRPPDPYSGRSISRP
jgi:acyl-CoA synthetase (AMP-forming)/AMP-acid ligase II